MNLSVKKTSISLLISLVLITLLTLVFAQMVVFADAADEIKKGACEVAGNCKTAPGKTLNETIASVINILSLIGGILAVIFIIVSGFKYITSAGKQESVAGAKKTLVYAVIGLVVIALAQVIVRFVLSNATNPNTTKQSSSSAGGVCTTTQYGRYWVNGPKNGQPC